MNAPAPRNKAGLVTGAAIGAAGALLGAAWLAGRRMDDARITYPPLDIPKPVGEDLWIVDSGPIVAAGARLPVRMTVARLADSGLWLHSPVQLTNALASALAALGPVRHLVAPTFAHWTFLGDWQAAFPEATVWAAPNLRERPQVRRAGLRVDADLGETAPPAWADRITQGVISGAGGFSEVWFFHRPSRTLILTDLIENLEPARLTPLTALAMTAMGATRGKVAFHVRAALAPRAVAVRAAVERMRALAPERVILAHGRWFETNGTARLDRAFGWLLDAP